MAVTQSDQLLTDSNPVLICARIDPVMSVALVEKTMQILRSLIVGLAALSFASPALIAQVPDRPSYLDQKKNLPKGNRFADLLPAKVADFARISFKEPEPGLDGEALYKSGEQEIFMLFSLAENREDVDEIRKTIRAEVQKEKLSQPQQSRVGHDLGYIRLIGKTIAFYAWNRGLYCFSADSKQGDKAALDRFMQAFPY